MKVNIHVLNSKERKEIRNLLSEQFGVSELPKDKVYFHRNNKERVYICNRELFDVDHRDLRVNMFGVYFGAFLADGFRLSMEGAQLIGPLATKNSVELSSSQRDRYLMGEDIEFTNPTKNNTIILLKSGKDFLGFAKFKVNTIINYLS